MRPPFDKGETITLNRRKPTGTYDAYGDVVYTLVPETVAGAVIWPQSSIRATTEVTQSMDRTNSIYICLLPSSVDVNAIDIITWRGKDYEVNGQPERYQSPLTGGTVQTVRINRVEG